MPQRLSRAQSRARTRTELLAAAARVFAQRGFVAATVEEVAEAAGYTKGAVYYNFADKEELFLALLDERVEASLDAITEVLAQPDDDTHRDRNLDTAMTRLHNQNRDWCLLATEFWLYAMRKPAVAARLAAQQQRLHHHVVTLFEHRCSRDGIRPQVRPADIATVLLAFDTGLGELALTDARLAPEGLYGRVVQLLRHVLRNGWPEDEPAP